MVAIYSLLGYMTRLSPDVGCSVSFSLLECCAGSLVCGCKKATLRCMWCCRRVDGLGYSLLSSGGGSARGFSPGKARCCVSPGSA